MSDVGLNPLGDRVLIEPIALPSTTPAGLYIPETAQDKPQEGTVLAVGQGNYSDNGVRIPLDVKVGDKVLFAKYSGNEVTIDGRKLVLMRQLDLLAIVD